jgi:hypothetical protein
MAEYHASHVDEGACGSTREDAREGGGHRGARAQAGGPAQPRGREPRAQWGSHSPDRCRDAGEAGAGSGSEADRVALPVARVRARASAASFLHGWDALHVPLLSADGRVARLFGSRCRGCSGLSGARRPRARHRTVTWAWGRAPAPAVAAAAAGPARAKARETAARRLRWARTAAAAAAARPRHAAGATAAATTPAALVRARAPRRLRGLAAAAALRAQGSSHNQHRLSWLGAASGLRGGRVRRLPPSVCKAWAAAQCSAAMRRREVTLQELRYRAAQGRSSAFSAIQRERCAHSSTAEERWCERSRAECAICRQGSEARPSAQPALLFGAGWLSVADARCSRVQRSGGRFALAMRY